MVIFFQILPEKDSASGPHQSLQSILSLIEGVGTVQIYIYEEESTSTSGIFSTYFESPSYSSPIGILIVAEGAKDDRIKRLLKETVTNVMDVPAHRVVIVPMKEEE